MHMLPIYYNTTNNKKHKKRKLTQKEISARLQHEKFLQKMTERDSPKLTKKSTIFNFPHRITGK